jgi:hypothetical protein
MNKNNQKCLIEVEQIIEQLNLPHRMMNELEVAEVKQCSVQALRNKRHLGRGIPYHKDGRLVRYNPYDVAIDILNSRIVPEDA